MFREPSEVGVEDASSLPFNTEISEYWVSKSFIH